MSIIRRDQFTGSNNIAKPERLPEGAVVDAVNMDFTVGGKAELRTGYVKVLEGTDIRGVFSLGDGSVAIIDGDKLLRVNGGQPHELATVSQGPVAATMHNGELFLNTITNSLKIQENVEPWAITPPPFDVALVDGSMKPGIYKVAVTVVSHGRESGCWPASVNVPEGYSIRVNTAGGINHRLYSSVANGQSLYYQGIAASYNYISSPVDNTSRLETGMLTSLPFCSILASYKGLIVGANKRFLYFTKPMHPHLHDPESGFLQFPSEITIIAPSDFGVYVGTTDKTYFIASLAGDDMTQRIVADFGAISGTCVSLPDGTSSWFSVYGQVISGVDGAITLLNKDSYSPDTAMDGAAGYIEHNGNRMVVTTMRGERNGSSLKSTDYWDIEVI